jgi:hypothetical protein
MRVASLTKTSLRRLEKPRLKMPFKNFLSGKRLRNLNHIETECLSSHFHLLISRYGQVGSPFNRKYQVLSLFPLPSSPPPPSSSSPHPFSPPLCRLAWWPRCKQPSISPLLWLYGRRGMVVTGLWWLHCETVVWTSNIPFIQVYACTVHVMVMLFGGFPNYLTMFSSFKLTERDVRWVSKLLVIKMLLLLLSNRTTFCTLCAHLIFCRSCQTVILTSIVWKKLWSNIALCDWST